MSALPAVPVPVRIQPGRAQGDAVARIALPGPGVPRLAPGGSRRPANRHSSPGTAGGAGPVAKTSDERACAGLAADIRRIRQQLTSLDTLNHPRVLTELHELYTL